MGCLKSILKKILIILLIAAFFTLGGWAFCKKKISEYKNPPREVFVETEKEFADFAYVSGDYQLCRCFNFFGFKKIVAKYLPTSQKIAIYDLKDEELISVSDFHTGEINDKIEEILNLILKTLIYNCVLKHIFLYRLQEDKHTYIPNYYSKRKIREEVLTHP